MVGGSRSNECRLCSLEKIYADFNILESRLPPLGLALSKILIIMDGPRNHIFSKEVH
jgi:hypothetical protein